MSVFFRKLRINENTGTATIIVTDKPISSQQREKLQGCRQLSEQVVM